MVKEVFMNLQHSESVVATMAATIFAAYVGNNEVTASNEEVFVKKAVDAAIKLAALTDAQVKSDSEWMKPQQ